MMSKSRWECQEKSWITHQKKATSRSNQLHSEKYHLDHLVGKPTKLSKLWFLIGKWNHSAPQSCPWAPELVWWCCLVVEVEVEGMVPRNHRWCWCRHHRLPWWWFRSRSCSGSGSCWWSSCRNGCHHCHWPQWSLSTFLGRSEHPKERDTNTEVDEVRSSNNKSLSDFQWSAALLSYLRF